MNPKPAKQATVLHLSSYRPLKEGSKTTTVFPGAHAPDFMLMPASQAKKGFGRQVAVFEGC